MNSPKKIIHHDLNPTADFADYAEKAVNNLFNPRNLRISFPY